MHADGAGRAGAAGRRRARRGTTTCWRSSCRTARRPRRAAVAAAAGRRSGEAGFTRSDAVVTFGGGATTDLGGFVAATWLRGVRVVHVPTTLLGMVDAAVGGKTGINTAAGKNLVGAFHEPAGVLCDLALLDDAAAPRSWSPGWPRWSSAASSPTRRSSSWSRTDPAAARPRTRRCCASSSSGRSGSRSTSSSATCARPAAADGHPGREVLNYGHTLGHAIERAERLPVRHGEAVAIGCVFAAELARLRRPARRRRRRAAPRGVRPGSGCRRRTPVRRSTTCWRRCGWTRSPAATSCGSWCSTTWPSPRILAGPTEDDLRAAYDGDRRRGDEGAGAQRPQPGPARSAAAGDLRRHHARRARRAVRRTGARELGLEVEVRQTNHEGELLDWLNDAADDDDPGRAQRRGVDALLARRSSTPAPSSPRRWSRCTSRDPAAAARGVPAHLGGHAARRRGDRRPGRRRLPPRARPACDARDRAAASSPRPACTVRHSTPVQVRRPTGDDRTRVCHGTQRDRERREPAGGGRWCCWPCSSAYLAGVGGTRSCTPAPRGRRRQPPTPRPTADGRDDRGRRRTAAVPDQLGFAVVGAADPRRTSPPRWTTPTCT